MGTGRLSARRIITKMMLFLLLGAIVNVAVSVWLCVTTETGGALGYTTPTLWDRSSSNLAMWRVAEYRTFGSLELVTATNVATERLQLSAWAFAKPNGMILLVSPASDTPSWSFARRSPPTLATDQPYIFVQESARGWPMLALRCEILSDLTSAPGSIPSSYGVAWSVRNRPVPGWPIWPGFAINTTFYAAILWLLFAAPFALRRRRRIKHGLCVKCAYDLRGSPADSRKCPECGAPLERNMLGKIPKMVV